MLVKATCKKCGGSGYFDIGEMTKEEFLKKFSEIETFHCYFGNHVEISSPIDYFDIGWEDTKEGTAPGEDEFVEGLKANYLEVLNTKELCSKYIIDSFYGGMCLCHRKDDEDINYPTVFQFVSSPRGERYYIIN